MAQDFRLLQTHLRLKQGLRVHLRVTRAMQAMCDVLHFRITLCWNIFLTPQEDNTECLCVNLNSDGHVQPTKSTPKPKQSWAEV